MKDGKSIDLEAVAWGDGEIPRLRCAIEDWGGLLPFIAAGSRS
jgi:hypothetical protein